MKNIANVLISGGSGLVGTRLTEMLEEKGYSVSHLSRSMQLKKGGTTVYHWDIDKQIIDVDAVANADCIVHLAGAGVVDKRWTNARKKILIDSRVKSAKLIEKELKAQRDKGNNKCAAFISASGIGYYGDSGQSLVTENSPLGDDFLAEICDKWEKASDGIEALGIRRTLLRIGIVLDKDGGALPKIAAPVKMGVGAYFGNGKQMYSWIHIDDLCRLFILAIENQTIHGIYNAVAPNPLSNYDFTKTVSNVLNRPFIPAPAPKFVMNLTMGERMAVLFNSNLISCKKAINAGFDFEYKNLEDALKEIYG